MNYEKIPLTIVLANRLCFALRMMQARPMHCDGRIGIFVFVLDSRFRKKVCVAPVGRITAQR